MRYTVLNSCVTFDCTVSAQKVAVSAIVTSDFTLKRFANLLFSNSLFIVLCRPF